MVTRITATQLAKSLSDILNRIRYRGERFLVERNGEAVASLGPAPPTAGITARQLVSRLKDVSMPGDGFADDLEAIQASQPRVGAPPWDA